MAHASQTLKGKLPPESELLDFLCLDCENPLVGPVKQTDCVDGCRLCGECYDYFKRNESLFTNGSNTIACKRCGGEFRIDGVNNDRAAERELTSGAVVFPCYHDGCTWTGSNTAYSGHFSSHVEVDMCSCLFCDEQVRVTDYYDKHMLVCSGKPTECSWCHIMVAHSELEDHLLHNCLEHIVLCPHCAKELSRKKLLKHEEKCRSKTWRCKFSSEGCSFEGNWVELIQHCGTVHPHHQSMKKKPKCYSTCIIRKIPKVSYTRGHSNSMARPSSPVKKCSGSIRSEKKFYLKNISEQVVLVRESKREEERRHEDSMFEYTDPLGYQVIVCAYLNGYEGGEGTHLSFGVLVMRGREGERQEHPAIVSKIKLTLVDQRHKKKHIVGRHKPDLLTIQGFHDAMLAGKQYAVEFPYFAPLSILKNASYVLDDVMCLKCAIDTEAYSETQPHSKAQPHSKTRPCYDVESSEEDVLSPISSRPLSPSS